MEVFRINVNYTVSALCRCKEELLILFSDISASAQVSLLDVQVERSIS